MNKFSTYILLVLVFLGLSKSFSPSEQRILYVENEHVYSTFFKGAPLEVILVDYFKAGFLIKTYFHRYKVVHGFKNPEFVTVRVSRRFWNKNKDHIGMSLFRRREIDNAENIVPLPPGSLFLGDPSFGFWELDSQKSTHFWVFHRAYKNFPNFFSWGEFVPDQNFYKAAMTHQGQEKVFFGLNNEFGSNGPLTKKMYPQSRIFVPVEKIHFKELLKRFLTTPWRNEAEQK